MCIKFELDPTTICGKTSPSQASSKHNPGLKSGGRFSSGPGKAVVFRTKTLLFLIMSAL